MKSVKKWAGRLLLKATRILPPKSAAAGCLIGLAAWLTTTTTSCQPQVMCYDPAPPDTIPQDTLDSTRQNVPGNTILNIDEKR